MARVGEFSPACRNNASNEVGRVSGPGGEVPARMREAVLKTSPLRGVRVVVWREFDPILPLCRELPRILQCVRAL
ncbi:hypothetical protein E2C01_035381 [Portunus trituberculatus]|uniref:Uncharacterized protein n=1 Tax=Portunus trituberculatus TaxID=210409 RepID=A0A5B7F8B0_PORTR|nr:hypothetical protein [Portunus trituberculatus]